MAIPQADEPGCPPVRISRRATGEPAQPARLHHHSVVAVSLILVLASAVHIGVWLIASRLPAATFTEPSCVIAHGLLYDVQAVIVTRVTRDTETARKAMFAVCLVIALSSTLTWYTAARLALGPTWALWTGLAWAAHPSFAFLAQRPGRLTLLMALIPLVWCTLLWWERSRRAAAAAGLGLALAMLSLASIQGLLLAPILLLAVLAVHPRTSDYPRNGRRATRWTHLTWALAGFVLGGLFFLTVTLPWLPRNTTDTDTAHVRQRLAADMWNALDTGDGSAVAEAAHAVRSHNPPEDWRAPWRLLANRLRQDPLAVVTWLGDRSWRALYQTADGRLHRPLLAMQLACLLPALWGWVVALRHRPWRWMAITAGLMAAATWLVAALAEPLARNLTPVGGLMILFALIGVADLYERIFGRRLTRPTRRSDARPDRLGPL